MTIQTLIKPMLRFIRHWLEQTVLYLAIMWLCAWVYTTHLTTTPTTINGGALAFMAVGLAFVATVVETITHARQQQQLKVFARKLQSFQADPAANGSGGRIILHPDDPLQGLAQAINDGHDRTRQRAQRSEEQARTLHVLLEQMPVGVLRITPDHQVHSVNEEARRLLGVTTNVLSRPFEDVLQHHQLVAMGQQALQSQAQQRQLIQFKGRQLDVSVTYYLAGQQASLLMLLYDVTEMARLERQQVDFVANASHELRTPLTSLVGFAETLLAGAHTDEATRLEFLHYMQTDAQRLLTLTQDILALAKIPEKRTEAQAIHLADFIADQIRVHPTPLAVNNHVDPTLITHQDADDLTSIVGNLLENALKYNGPTGSVTLDATVGAGALTLTVQDTGIGIASNQQARIFERFYRIDKSRQQKVPGTGLGLAIVADLVAARGGTITVKSQLGVGTTMTVVLPEHAPNH